MLQTLTSWWGTDVTPLVLRLLLLLATTGTAWLVAVSLVSWLFRRSAAETRAALWAVGMIGLLALAVGHVWLPPVSVSTSSRAWLALQDFAPMADRSHNTGAAAGIGAEGNGARDARVRMTSSPTPNTRDLTVTVDVPASSASSTPAVGTQLMAERWGGVTTFVVLLWLVGALIMTVRFVRGTRNARRLWRSASRSYDGPQWTVMQEVCEAIGVQRPVSLRLVEGAQIPMTIGIIHPEVLLPASSLTWHHDRLRMVLQHELGHIARYDLAFATLAQVVVIGCWWHPLVWHAMHALEREREHACDDMVLRSGVAPVRYADELLSVVRELRNPAPSAFATLAMARSSDIELRLKALLNPSARRHRLSRSALAVMAVAVALLLPLGHVVPVQATTVTPSLLRDTPIVVASSKTLQRTPTLPHTPTPPDTPASPNPQGLPPTATAQATVAHDNDRKVLELGKPCHAVKPGSSSITRSRSDDAFDDYTRSDATGCLRVSRTGRVLVPTDDAPAVLDNKGRLLIEQAIGNDIRRVVITRRDNRVSDVVTRNGAAVTEGGSAPWVRTLLLSAYRETGLGAEERVARIIREGGVSALLEEIALIPSEDTRVRYFELGLQAELPDDERVRLAQSAIAFAARVGSRGDRARIEAAAQPRRTP